MKFSWFCFVVLWVATASWAQESPRDRLVELRKSAAVSIPLETSALDGSATSRAAALAKTQVLSHTDDRGRGPGAQMVAEGFPLGEYGEVLGSGPSLAAVWRGWLQSPAHRAVLERDGWVEWGWGRAEVGTTSVWVVRFRRP